MPTALELFRSFFHQHDILFEEETKQNSDSLTQHIITLIPEINNGRPRIGFCFDKNKDLIPNSVFGEVLSFDEMHKLEKPQNEKSIIGVGKYQDPTDTDYPYFISLKWFDNHSSVTQPISEKDLLKIFNNMADKYDLKLNVKLGD